jgi:hypothetical protein
MLPAQSGPPRRRRSEQIPRRALLCRSKLARPIDLVAQSFTLRPPIGLSPGVYRIGIAPSARDSTELAVLEIETTRLSEVASLDRGG